MFGSEHGSPRAGGYSDPLELALLRESLEPPRFPFCLCSGNPVEGAKFYRGGGGGGAGDRQVQGQRVVG